MRLTKIKLAGFKSFVDPTSIPLPSNLIGVVGPNGCGKSNVIDAVRWVMGESSAKHLRGDSMADVIFNGSSARKPVGQATVEMLFDNSDGTIKGEFAGYNEISIRRTVSRDGQSQYFLNGTRCRRRDVTGRRLREPVAGEESCEYTLVHRKTGHGAHIRHEFHHELPLALARPRPMGRCDFGVAMRDGMAFSMPG